MSVVDDYLESRGISPAAKFRFDLSYNAIADALVIPVRDSDSRLRGEMFRYLSPDAPLRYRWHKGKPYLFNADGVAHPSIDVVIVCEGQIDAMSCWDALGRVGEPRKSSLVMQAEACGLPGASSWRREYGALLEGKRVIVLADGDDAGKEMLRSVERDLEGFSSFVMASGTDVNDYARDRGRLRLRQLIEDLASSARPVRLKPEEARKRASGYRGDLIVPVLLEAGIDVSWPDVPDRRKSVHCPLPGHNGRGAHATFDADGRSFYCPTCRNDSGGNVFRANALRKHLGLKKVA